MRKKVLTALVFFVLLFVFSSGSALAADYPVTNYAELVAALGTATTGDTITIDGEIVLTDNIDLYAPQHTGLILQGINGGTLTGNPAWPLSGNSSDYSVITIHSADNVIIRNLIFQDGGAHGINIYVSDNIFIQNVSSLNNDKAGLVVNGSTVEVENFHTAGNGWGGANVDQGSGVTEYTELIVDSTSTFAETPQVWLDQPDETDIVFTPVGATYTEVTPGVYERVPDPEPTAVPNPQTGDTTNYSAYSLLIAVLLVGTVIAAFVIKRKSYSH